MTDMGVIYVFRCPYTNRVVYVGQTQSPQYRLSEHYKSDSIIGRYLRAIKTMGLEAKFEIIEEFENNINIHENNWIRHYASLGEANHNYIGNESIHICRLTPINRPDSEPSIICEKIKLFNEIKMAFWSKSCVHDFNIYALRSIHHFCLNKT